MDKAPYMQENETIVGVATPPGVGGVAIVRISGPRAAQMLSACFTPGAGAVQTDAADIPDHLMRYGYVREDSGAPIDEAMAVLMRAPRSYTCEDVAELHVHGGRMSVERTVARVLALGARMAAPGEFTRRAFEHGRIDLSQAEAVMDAIAAQGERAAAQAMRQLTGALRRDIEDMQAVLTNLLAHIEVTVDYPEEDLERETLLAIEQGVCAALARVRALLAGAKGARYLREGLRVALWGRPNAGKSSLLNALLGAPRAIVTDIPGTTRDTLEETLVIDGLCVRLIDTAGLREAAGQVEAMGVARAERALREADASVLVIDASLGIDPADEARAAPLAGKPLIVALNKDDLAACVTEQEVRAAFPQGVLLRLSARTGEGIDALRRAIADVALSQSGAGDGLLANPRHIAALQDALAAMELALAGCRAQMPPDVVAIDVRDAWTHLGRVTGSTCDEDILDAIFSQFCLGK
nr:tRNA uridine-5-carboxymethylaminomethyl(34) synthesis GTPase MnmE [Maliibacterium massiliense]